MKIGILLRSVFASVIMASSSQALADDRTDFQQQYVALRAAMDTRESGKIKAILTSDFRSVDIQGNIETADSMITALAAVPVDPTRKRETVIDSVTITGSQSHVAQHYSTTLNRAGPDGLDHSIHIEARSNDVWMQIDGHWLLARIETREMAISRDGVEVRHINLDH